MPELTPKLGLKKPLGNETVSRAAYRENLDIIDSNAAAQTDLDAHKNAAAPHSGHETPAGAQAKVDAAINNHTGAADPHPQYATDTDLSAHTALTAAAHGATSAATASTLMARDANGRAKVAAPAAADDIARKDTVDAVQNNLDTLLADIVTVATPNKILKLNGIGKLPASITGDAVTVSGYSPSTTPAANKIPVTDGTGKIPSGFLSATSAEGSFTDTTTSIPANSTYTKQVAHGLNSPKVCHVWARNTTVSDSPVVFAIGSTVSKVATGWSLSFSSNGPSYLTYHPWTTKSGYYQQLSHPMFKNGEASTIQLDDIYISGAYLNIIFKNDNSGFAYTIGVECRWSVA